MSQFDRVANHILSKLDENFISSASDAIQHTWAKTIAHPGLGEEDEEFAVVDHSLTSDGIIEEYYVEYKGKLVAVPAGEAIIIEEKPPHEDDEKHGAKPKKDDAEKLDSDEKEDE